MKNRHLEAMLFGTPLAIEAVKLEAILRGLGEKLDLDIETEAAAAPVGSPAERKPYLVQDGLAIINVFGSLSQRSLGLRSLSGMSSYDEIAAELSQALADADVKRIVLRVDSCGGEVAGMFDLADKIRAATKTKPICAIAEDKAYSAAYCLACAADEVYVTQAGGVGSIGIILAHTDTSMADAAAGRKVSIISAGARKADGVPSLQGSAAWKAVEERVNKMYDLFTAKVAEYRGMSQAAVKATEAGVFQGEDGVKAGLADGVLSFDELLARLGADPNAADAEDNTDPGVVPVEVLFGTAPCGAQTEAHMPTEPKGAPQAGAAGGEVIDLAAAQKVIADLQAENAKLVAQAKLDAAVAETKAKADVIAKHQARGALVPAMLPLVNEVAAHMNAEQLDAKLSSYPVQAGADRAVAGSFPTPEAAIAAVTAAPAAKEAQVFELDAEAKALADQFGWSKKDLEAFHGVSKIQMTAEGPVAIYANGKKVALKDINAGRA